MRIPARIGRWTVAMTFAGTFALATASAQQNAQTRPARAVESHPPVVVKTVPEAGATDVDPTLTEIRVTFSKEMTDGNWAFARVNPESYPQTTGRPRYLEDKRTCVLPVKLEPGKGYVIWLNRPPYDSFMDTGKRKAVSYLLTFETKAP